MALGERLAAVLAACYRNSHYRLYNTVMASLLVPPALVRGMTRLDPDAFALTLEVPYLNLGQTNPAKVMPTLKKYILKMERMKPIQDAADGKRAYLDPDKVKDLGDIAEVDRELLADNNVKVLERAEMTIKYENWRSDQILRALLPEDMEVPKSYSIIGHILHLNLRDSQLPYRKLIGQVLLDKVSRVRTVVNKLNVIDTTFRHFKMEILAGDADVLAKVSENGCTYKFDFSTVYWNPRLCTEHAALTALLKPGDVLYDVFAGVGPFAVPAARKGVQVLANDLNPESHKWLQENARLNRVEKSLKAFNKDGREFIRKEVKEDIINRRKGKISGTEHIAMNLPAMATEFLDVFSDSDWLTEAEAKQISDNPPTVHLYCFVKLGRGEDPYNLARLLVEEKLCVKLSTESLVKIHNVRNVSPNKEMMRVSFLLTYDILRGGEPAKKKAKTVSSTESPVNDNLVGENGKEQGRTKDEECVQGGGSS